MELDFAIAVDQQTRARKRTFEGVPDPGAHRCLRDSHAHGLSFFGPILPNNLNMLNTMLWGGLFVANYLLNLYILVPKTIEIIWISAAHDSFVLL